MAAGAAGRPFLAFSHEPKLAGLARRLEQSWVPPHAPTAVLVAATQALCDQAPPMTPAVHHEAVVAEQAMDLLRVVVSGGKDDHVLDRDRLALTNDGAAW